MIIVTIKNHGREYTAKMEDNTTWTDLLEVFIDGARAMGYRLDKCEVIEASEES